MSKIPFGRIPEFDRVPKKDSPEYVDFIMKYGSPEPLPQETDDEKYPWQSVQFWMLIAIIVLLFLS